MQAIQQVAHKALARGSSGSIVPGPATKLLSLITPLIRGQAAKFIGIGFQPEHVDQTILEAPLDTRASR
jgi:hypothetical protein